MPSSDSSRTFVLLRIYRTGRCNTSPWICLPRYKKNPIIKNYLKRRKLTRWPRSVGSGERYPWSLRWWRARDCNWTIVKKVNKQKWSFRAISWSTQKKNFRREMIDTDGWTQMESMQKPFVGARWARNECFFLLKEASEISGSEEQLNSRVVRYRFLPIFHRRISLC